MQLVMLPMFLFATTFFPLTVYPRPVQVAGGGAAALPRHPAAAGVRPRPDRFRHDRERGLSPGHGGTGPRRGPQAVGARHAALTRAGPRNGGTAEPRGFAGPRKPVERRSLSGAGRPAPSGEFLDELRQLGEVAALVHRHDLAVRRWPRSRRCPSGAVGSGLSQ